MRPLSAGGTRGINEMDEFDTCLRVSSLRGSQYILDTADDNNITSVR
jgi:hypothetical protein